MPTLPQSSEEQSRRLVYFAAERTLTSWIRTALSLMTLGFVIDRFDLVVRRVLGAKVDATESSRELWRWGGSILIGLGVLMAVMAGIYYLRFARHYRRDGGTEMGHSLLVGALFTFALGGCGVVLLVVLEWVLR